MSFPLFVLSEIIVLYLPQPPIGVLMSVCYIGFSLRSLHNPVPRMRSRRSSAAAMATVKASTTCQSRRSDECLASTQEELEAVKKQLKDAVSQIEQEEDSNSSNDYRLCPLYMNNVWGC